jgi:hypothetical protein
MRRRWARVCLLCMSRAKGRCTILRETAVAVVVSAIRLFLVAVHGLIISVCLAPEGLRHSAVAHARTMSIVVRRAGGSGAVQGACPVVSSHLPFRLRRMAS